MEFETIRIPVAASRLGELVDLVHGRGREVLQPAATQVEVWYDPDGSAALVAVVWTSPEQHHATAARSEVQDFFQQVAALADGPPRMESYLAYRSTTD